MTREQYLLKIIADHVRDRINQHRVNLASWMEEGGCLIYTEPDQDERECVRRELKAALRELDQLNKIIAEVQEVASP